MSKVVQLYGDEPPSDERIVCPKCQGEIFSLWKVGYVRCEACGVWCEIANPICAETDPEDA